MMNEAPPAALIVGCGCAGTTVAVGLLEERYAVAGVRLRCPDDRAGLESCA